MTFLLAPKSIHKHNVSVGGSVGGHRSMARYGSNESDPMTGLVIDTAGLTSRHQITKSICRGPVSVFCRYGCCGGGGFSHLRARVST